MRKITTLEEKIYKCWHRTGAAKTIPITSRELDQSQDIYSQMNEVIGLSEYTQDPIQWGPDREGKIV